jgi:hypothetical protein
MSVVLVVSIVFASVLGALYLILDHLKSRRSHGSGQVMTQSELSGLIEDAVESATMELRRRIENLEAIAVEEPGPGERLRLESPDERDHIEAPGRESQRVRS